jgi:lipid-A-disaccharide synthase
VKVKFISLVNLICEKEVVKELIQSNFNPKNLKQELSSVLNDENRRQQIFGDYIQLRAKLGGPGASQKVARKIIMLLQPASK